MTNTIFFPLLTVVCTTNSMDMAYVKAVNMPYKHNELTFHVAGEIILGDKVGFGSQELIQEIENAGIKVKPNELLTSVDVLLPASENTYYKWTDKAPLSIENEIMNTAQQQLQEEEHQLQQNPTLEQSDVFTFRQRLVPGDALNKFRKLTFPPALPVRCLETNSIIAVENGFDGCISYKLTFDNHDELDRTRQSNEVVIFAPYSKDLLNKKVALKSLLATRDRDPILETHIQDRVLAFQQQGKKLLQESNSKLEEQGIIAHDYSQLADQAPVTSFLSHLILYTDSTIIPGPNAKTDSKGLALEHHGIKRPFDLVQSRQTGPLTKKQRLNL